MWFIKPTLERVLRQQIAHSQAERLKAQEARQWAESREAYHATRVETLEAELAKFPPKAVRVKLNAPSWPQAADAHA